MKGVSIVIGVLAIFVGGLAGVAAGDTLSKANPNYGEAAMLIILALALVIGGLCGLYGVISGRIKF